MKYWFIVIACSALAAVIAVLISTMLGFGRTAVIGGAVGGAIAGILATKLKK